MAIPLLVVVTLFITIFGTSTSLPSLYASSSSSPPPPPASSSEVQPASTCPPCGGLEIPFPLSTGSDCGDPNYRLYCINNTLQFLSLGGVYYQVLSIDPAVNMLVIAAPAIQRNACASSDLKQGGLTLDEALPFNISKRNEVMLFNCPKDILFAPLNCTSSSPCRRFEATSAGRSCRNTLCCSYLKDSSMTSHRIRIRVGGCTAYTSVVNMGPNDPISTWNFGIELMWA